MKSTESHARETRTIPAGEFKAKCLQLMDEINDGSLTVIVTKRGTPVVRITAPTAEKKIFRPLWGRSSGARILGDIMAPMDWPDPIDKWKGANSKRGRHAYKTSKSQTGK